MQNRPGAMDAIDRALIARYGQRRRLLAKFGVPLVWAFQRGDMEAIAAEKDAVSRDRPFAESP